MIRYLIKKESNKILSRNEINKTTTKYNCIIKEMSKINKIKNEEINLENIRKKMDEYDNINKNLNINSPKINFESNSVSLSVSGSVSITGISSCNQLPKGIGTRIEPEIKNHLEKKILEKYSTSDLYMSISNYNDDNHNNIFIKDNNNDINSNVCNSGSKIISNYFNFLEKSEKDRYLFEQENLDFYEKNEGNNFFDYEKKLDLNNNHNINMNVIYKININEINDNEFKNLLMKNFDEEEKIFFGI